MIVPRDQLVTLWQMLHEAGTGMREEARAEADRAESAGDRVVGIQHGADRGGDAAVWDRYYRELSADGDGALVFAGGGGDEGVLSGAGDRGADARAQKRWRGCWWGCGCRARSCRWRGRIFLRNEGAQMGMVTSSCLSPMLGNVPVAMGYVKKAFARWGKRWKCWRRGAGENASVVELPFWK